MPFREPGIRRTRAAGKDRRPFLDREREVGFDLLHLHSRSLRSELSGRVQRIALPDVAERITKFHETLFLYSLVKEEARPGAAHLALAKAGRHRCALHSRAAHGHGNTAIRLFPAMYQRI